MSADEGSPHGHGGGGPSKSMLVPVTLCLVFVAFVFAMHALPYLMTSGKRKKSFLGKKKKAVELKVQ